MATHKQVTVSWPPFRLCIMQGMLRYGGEGRGRGGNGRREGGVGEKDEIRAKGLGVRTVGGWGLTKSRFKV